MRFLALALLLATSVQAEDPDIRYVEALIEQERALREQQYQSAQRALTKAEDAMTLRLHAQNNVLTFVQEQQKHFATKEGLAALEGRVTKLERERDTWTGGWSVLSALGGAAFALLLALMAIWARRPKA
jgi:hypothetical protein